ncbi:hypothetical protein IWZ03DRAFT_364427 [Phyllosticta citriasiana]|uniref:Secreted protein n=1 Tax=Phyllosticta citriasiana TaxID=595635 RepID=A0ABR1KWW8_9PEZI
MCVLCCVSFLFSFFSFLFSFSFHLSALAGDDVAMATANAFLLSPRSIVSDSDRFPGAYFSSSLSLFFFSLFLSFLCFELHTITMHNTAARKMG